MSALPAVQPLSPVPLSQDQAGMLDRLTRGLDDSGLWWLSGYAAGLARSQEVQSTGSMTPAPHDTPASRPITVIYGSQSGNAKRLSENLVRTLEADRLPVRLLRADVYPLRELKDERELYIIISTQGDGDPPDDARALVDFIAGKRAPKLPGLRFAVLGLGDSSYPHFCAVGRRLDERLDELGATRAFSRGDADLDVETVATPWLASAQASARELFAAANGNNVTPLHPASPGVSATTPSATPFTREAPFHAELLANQRITGDGSLKDIRHIELSLEGSGLHYRPGDALGVWPRNPAPLIDEVLETLGLSGEEVVSLAGQELPLRHWLEDKRELTRLSRPFVAAHAERSDDAGLRDVLQPDNVADLASLLAGQQLIDLLQRHPASWDAQSLVAALRPLAPRLYSIASSQAAVGDEVHLTVAHVEYAFDGRTRGGAASHWIASRGDNDRLPVFIESNDRFRLPVDGSRDIIMIGPGTGVAPFRAFVQERAEAGATGRNWLLFGNPHFRSDFLYQLEWQRALKTGQLERLDLAFSRDQPEKIYVQQRLREQGRELYARLDNGAHLYVCGDATRMARDVHEALIEVIAEHGGHSRDAAQAQLDDLQRQGRYARDIY